MFALRVVGSMMRVDGNDIFYMELFVLILFHL